MVIVFSQLLAITLLTQGIILQTQKISYVLPLSSLLMRRTVRLLLLLVILIHCVLIFQKKTGFNQLVCEVTHGSNLLDKVFTNRPDLMCTTVHQSLLKTKHMAVVAIDVNSMGGDQSPCRRHSVKLFDHRTHNIDKQACCCVV